MKGKGALLPFCARGGKGKGVVGESFKSQRFPVSSRGPEGNKQGYISCGGKREKEGANVPRNSPCYQEKEQRECQGGGPSSALKKNAGLPRAIAKGGGQGLCLSLFEVKKKERSALKRHRGNRACERWTRAQRAAVFVRVHAQISWRRELGMRLYQSQPGGGGEKKKGVGQGISSAGRGRGASGAERFPHPHKREGPHVLTKGKGGAGAFRRVWANQTRRKGEGCKPRVFLSPSQKGKKNRTRPATDGGGGREE